MNSGETLLKAAWVAPMDRAPLRDAAVVFHGGKIVAVGEAKALAGRYPDAAVTDLGDSILLPGLINAHTHLELSDCLCDPSPAGEFTDWLWTMIERSRLQPEELRTKVIWAVAKGVEQCLRCGVTAVGDISRQCDLTREVLADCPLHVVSYGEVQAMAQRRHLLEERVAAAADRTHATDRLRIGLSPHAPYSVEASGYQRCLAIAKERRMPMATHLAESPAEGPFLAGHRGPFRHLWEKMQGWDEKVPRFEGGSIRFAKASGMLDYPVLLAHVNYCDEEELAILAGGHASVVYCPRTHAYFGHPPHRWRQMLHRGINVAVGTDSCASSPDLNLLDDLRLLHELAAEVPALRLWEMATIRAAKAIMQEARIGSLSPGKLADMVAFAAVGGDPLAAILEDRRRPTHVWIGGVALTGK